MLNVGHGELPAEAACIYDVPIETIALPDPSDRYYSSALVKRLEIQTRNQSNRARRLTIVFNTRTRLFGMLIRSVKTKNPGFAQEMQEQCAIDDRSGTAVYGSRHRDGPKGYRMIQIHLTSAKGRTSSRRSWTASLSRSIVRPCSTQRLTMAYRALATRKRWVLGLGGSE